MCFLSRKHKPYAQADRRDSTDFSYPTLKSIQGKQWVTQGVGANGAYGLLFAFATSSSCRSLKLNLNLYLLLLQLHGNWQLALAKLRTFGHMVNVAHDKISQIYEVLQIASPKAE